MPKFVLPAPKKKPKTNKAMMSEGMEHDPLEWMRKITLPVNQEIIDALRIGDKVEVTLSGEVKKLASESTEKKDQQSLELEIKEVDVYQDRKSVKDMDQGQYERFRKSGGGK